MDEGTPGRSRPHAPHMSHGAFGGDRFGMLAERFARFFGTPGFLIGQSLFVLVWIVLNAVALTNEWDPYPFILLNLLFSTQAAYAAPLILLAQTRQSDRDRVRADEDQRHREMTQERFDRLMEENLRLVRHVAELTERLERR